MLFFSQICRPFSIFSTWTILWREHRAVQRHWTLYTIQYLLQYSMSRPLSGVPGLEADTGVTQGQSSGVEFSSCAGSPPRLTPPPGPATAAACAAPEPETRPASPNSIISTLKDSINIKTKTFLKGFCEQSLFSAVKWSFWWWWRGLSDGTDGHLCREPGCWYNMDTGWGAPGLLSIDTLLCLVTFSSNPSTGPRGDFELNTFMMTLCKCKCENTIVHAIFFH